MSELLKCENLSKRFGSKRALENVSLSIEPGKIIGLLGPNGAGKTTLIKIINGLLTPSSGSIQVDGEKVGTKTKAKVSYLPDVDFLYHWMRAEQIVSLFQEFFADFRADLAYQMLERLGINKKDRLKTLSKGNKEKMALILIMSRNASLYVLDEPIAGVDPAARDYIISTIINNYNPDSSVLISTHLISDIEDVLDEVIFLKNGQIVLHQGVDEIREQHQKSVDELFREVFAW